jgi:Tol biopolymer transport system component
MLKCRLLLLCLSVWAALIGCAPVAPTMTPIAFIATMPPTPTLPTVLPDICAETGNSYRLVTLSYAVRATARAVPTDTSLINLTSIASPDGSYSVARVTDSLYLRPQNGDDDIFLSSVPYDEFVMSENVFWSHDSQHVAIVEGEVFFSQALNVRVYNLAGESSLLNAELDQPSNVIGWSPDDRYFVMLSNMNLMSIWDWQTGERAFDFSNVDSNHLEWSPDGNYVAHYWTHNDPRNPTSGYDITVLDGSSTTRVQWNAGVYSDGAVENSLLWSPDSQYLMIFYVENYTAAYFRGLKVLQANGEEVLDLTRTTTEKDGTLINLPIYWSENSDAVLMWELQEDAHYQLLSYPLNGDEPETLMADVLRIPYAAPVGGRTALYDRQNERYSITLMDTDGENTVPFITDATDAGNPDWSSDGQTVAAVWATEDAAGRHVQLSWVDAAGENRHDIVRSSAGDYLDIQSLRWSLDNRYLMYIGVTPELAYSIDLVNLSTGEHQVLRADLSGVELVQYDTARGLFTFVWYTENGEFGFAGYNTDGTMAFDYLRSHRFIQFPSPDGQTFAIKGWTPDGETLLLATDEGETEYVLGSHLDGLGDPLWSPDSQMVMFTQWIQPSETTIHVYTLEGVKLWSTEYNWAWNLVGWESC